MKMFKKLFFLRFAILLGEVALKVGDHIFKWFQDLVILLGFDVLPGEVVIKLGDRVYCIYPKLYLHLD